MSTSARAAAARSAGGMTRRRLISGQLGLVFLAEFGMLASFYLLLSVTPRYVASAGGGSAGAGLMTGVLLLGTVAAELASSFLMRRYGFRAVLVGGAVLLGVPGLVFAGHTGYPAAFAMTGALMAAAVPMALQERSAAIARRVVPR